MTSWDHQHEVERPGHVQVLWQDMIARLIDNGRCQTAALLGRVGAVLGLGTRETVFNIAIAMHRAGQLNSALGWISRAVYSNPFDADARIARAELLCDLKRWRDAIADFDVVVDLRPRETGPILNRGVALACIGLLQQARADFERVLVMVPGDRLAERNLRKLEVLAAAA